MAASIILDLFPNLTAILSVIDDVSMDSEVHVVTSLIPRYTCSVFRIGAVHMGRMCACTHSGSMCVYVYTVFVKKKDLRLTLILYKFPFINYFD